jgi:hypothetical protein
MIQSYTYRRRPSRQGLVMWATLLAVILLVILMALISNMGRTVTAKLHVQNASDAMSFSSGVWLARGMNAITAANHLMGEVTALYVLHHSLGGDRLDQRKVTPMPWHQRPQVIEVAYRLLAATADVSPVAPEYVKDNVKADEESTLWQAKKKLKEHLLKAYAAHAAGVIVAKYPPTYSAGIAAQELAVLYQYKIKQEYYFLNLIEKAAVALIPVKTRVLPRILVALNTYTKLVYGRVPGLTQEIALEIAKHHDVVGEVVPTVLPVVRERVEGCNRPQDKRSQLMRAAYPWVHYWRKPLLDLFGTYAPLSEARQFYMKYTNRYSLRIVKEFRRSVGEPCSDSQHPERSLGLVLYVLENLDPPRLDKTQEPWAQHTPGGVAQADRMFGTLGLARQEKPNAVSARPFYRQEMPYGIVCFAESLVYNANPQKLARQYRRNSVNQPIAGWDTLNWDQSHSRVVEYPSKSYAPSSPKIKLNWQAKLVPVSRQQLGFAAAGSRDNGIRKVLHRIGAGGPTAQALVHH